MWHARPEPQSSLGVAAGTAAVAEKKRAARRGVRIAHSGKILGESMTVKEPVSLVERLAFMKLPLGLG